MTTLNARFDGLHNSRPFLENGDELKKLHAHQMRAMATRDKQRDSLQEWFRNLPTDTDAGIVPCGANKKDSVAKIHTTPVGVVVREYASEAEIRHVYDFCIAKATIMKTN